MTPAKWEYRSVLEGSRDGLVAQLALMGAQGWELVAVNIIPHDMHGSNMRLPMLCAFLKRARLA